MEGLEPARTFRIASPAKARIRPHRLNRWPFKGPLRKWFQVFTFPASSAQKLQELKTATSTTRSDDKWRPEAIYFYYCAQEYTCVWPSILIRTDTQTSLYRVMMHHDDRIAIVCGIGSNSFLILT